MKFLLSIAALFFLTSIVAFADEGVSLAQTLSTTSQQSEDIGMSDFNSLKNTESVEVVAYMNSTILTFDIDNDGRADALTDGLCCCATYLDFAEIP